ncbi:uncharacterized protein T551_00871 [Pneumocystis jirovecii RU7]|uniref:Uncharacterized protein n=1 Tax=Pneumocystis jirovecii (strain RU7) TaxID=1408657 RepID=A0A0W4ZUY2_PNEJ7|nr:uncharacterized protein T551_00871 [Pneumocystis jirovecii RU7]KTW32189.1 hypothetical protein T551_00871 [Pneumocystis jirovecii RU7]
MPRQKELSGFNLFTKKMAVQRQSMRHLTLFGRVCVRLALFISVEQSQIEINHFYKKNKKIKIQKLVGNKEYNSLLYTREYYRRRG